ncbi:LIVCS family branched-chain amino acid:cation transporter [Aneurinibacillus soli]|uniref:Branched-chain amino acid transport system carrier protein n=1 Tax=Aneurinibacillus soli TaxID=1500254 RepID=A0A0U5ARG3_9BACL|nr:branched-chain amino acid transport system II carrier protein [Aneurinibacillus soli]PYE60101.1 LIVCS family branched-chain amino acid:cation transporter [Aneurinibacillus soli]BAU26410.1 Branched-chain amino acid transport system 2 carrier protein [Aneurinibacillus soli]
MKSEKLPFSTTLIVGLTLFALFFGAGNLIFPASLGQVAGTNFWPAVSGFLITGVGLPLLGVVAMGVSGKTDLLSVSSRVHPWFGFIFTTALYLAIGPLFALPRTGSVSYEIGVTPFLPANAGHLPLLIFTVVFFTISCFFSLNPNRIVDIVGRFLTPLKLSFILILVLAGLIHPIGPLQPPRDEYVSIPFFKGFQEGYLTMDTLASFVFGMLVINSIKQKGVTSTKSIAFACLKSSVVAALLLIFIYGSLTFLGASSVSVLGKLDNGGQVLAQAATYYFQSLGGVLLGLMITVACLTTSIGLLSSCASFFHTMLPRIPYKALVVLLSVFSATMANIGLTQLISISVPILTAIYPMAIVLIFLTFLHPLFKGRSLVYQGAMLCTGLVSIFDGLKAANINVLAIDSLFNHVLPLYSLGLGWLLPGVVGGIVGFVISLVDTAKPVTSR